MCFTVNTQPQWTPSSAFVRQRGGEFRIGWVARDLYPKAFPLPAATLPLAATQRNPTAGLKAGVSLPPFYHLSRNQALAMSIRSDCKAVLPTRLRNR